LFKNIVDEIDNFLAPETLHFGFVRTDTGTSEDAADIEFAASLRINGAASGEREPVKWRHADELTVDIAGFAENIRNNLGISKSKFTAADFALQMTNGAACIRFTFGTPD
jgi:hypothetical protein